MFHAITFNFSFTHFSLPILRICYRIWC